MKLFTHKTFILIFVLPLIALLILLSYHYNKGISEHKVLLDSQKQFAYIETLNTLLFDIDRERSLSGKYLDSEDENISNKLKEAQKTVDKTIVDLKSRYNKQMSRSLFSSFSNLDKTRRKIEHKNIRFEALFFIAYAEGFSYPIINEMDRAKKIIEKQNTNDHFYHYIEISNLDRLIKFRKPKPNRALLDSYLELIRINENTSIERGFISHKIATQSPLTNSDLEIWDKLVAKDYLPDFNAMDDRPAADNFADSRRYKKLIRTIDLERMEIIFDASEKSPARSQNNRWDEAEADKIYEISTKESLISLSLNQNLSCNTAEKEKELLFLLLSMALLLILILILFILFGYYKNSAAPSKKVIKKDSAKTTIKHKKIKKTNPSPPSGTQEREHDIDFIEHLTLPD